LPTTWNDPQGAYRTDLANLSADDLTALGWVAIVEDIPAYDPARFTTTPGDVALVDGVPTRQ
jgi:hypothetical protein